MSEEASAAEDGTNNPKSCAQSAGINQQLICIPHLKLHPTHSSPFPHNDKTSLSQHDEKSHCFQCPLMKCSEFNEAYLKYQALHISGFQPPLLSPMSPRSSSDGIPQQYFAAKDVQPLFESLNDKDRESWCIENEANNPSDGSSSQNQKEKEHGSKTSPSIFLDVDSCEQRGYCSFLVQHSKDILSELLSNRLPMEHLPVAMKSPDVLSSKEMALLREKDVADGSNGGNQNCTNSESDKTRGMDSTSGSGNDAPQNESTQSQKKFAEDSSPSVMKVDYGPCLWFFFGKNRLKPNNSPEKDKEASSDECAKSLLGRPEHTDSVTHDGTWHYQLSGTKIWRLRPTTELIRHIEELEVQRQKESSSSGDCETNSGKKRKLNFENESHKENTPVSSNCVSYPSDSHIEVICRQGDIILINTRLWWHSTLIPPQDVPCISYARDIYLPKSGNEEKNNERENECNANQNNQQSTSMTNIDGTYAAEDIGASTILFTERNMPNCELHRSKTNPNCQVVELEDEESGETYMAVVTLRDIKAGEFFCILESDEEDGSDGTVSDEEFDAEEIGESDIDGQDDD